MRMVVIAVLVTASAVAAAEPSDIAEAAKIFQQGRELAHRGEFTEACVLFARSYALDPALGTAVNLADCLERQGELRRAWELYDVVANNSQNNQSRARFARARADALTARLTTVIIRVHAPALAGLSIQLGERTLPPAAEIRDLIEPGELALVATAPGRPAFKAALHAEAGATLTIDVPELAPPHDEPPPITRRLRSRVYAAGSLAGAGAVGLGISLGLAISARQIYNGAFTRDCQRAAGGPICNEAGKATIDRAGRRADVATGFVLGGALLAGAAALVYLTAPSEVVQAGPLAGDHALGLAISGQF